MISFLKNIRIIILLIVSLILYFLYDFKLFFVLLLISFFSFFISNLIILINNSSVKNNKIIAKVILIISILILLSILISYKYVKLFTPLGMSFFLYKAISFMIDSYDGKVDYDFNILTYVLYISYFPQILAGPIEKPNIFFIRVNDLGKIKFLDINRISDGTLILVYGIFIKFVLTDRLCISVNNIFSHYYDYGTFELFFGQILFTLQLYFDFLAYSYIVIGISKVLTLESSENFNAPLFSSSVKEFWRRWHISLSTWLKEYVYIKLGGNRCSKFRNSINLLITFAISGIWHGTNLTFLIWGILNGIYQMICMGISNKSIIKEYGMVSSSSYRFHFSKNLIIKGIHDKIDKFNIDGLNKFITFLLISFSFIFFRAKDINIAFTYIIRLFTRFNPWVLLNLNFDFLNLPTIDILIVLLSFIIVLFFDYKKYLDKDFFYSAFSNKIILKTIIIILLFSIVLIYGQYGIKYDKTAFIYGGF